MAQTNYTPISLYYSTTVSAAPTAGNLVNGELAINITDGKLYYKDNTGTVKVIAGTGGTGVVAGSNTQIQFNNSGVFGASANLTWDGTYLTANSIKNSALTSGRVTYAGASGLLQDSANLTFDGTTLTANALTVSNAVTLSGGTANGVLYLNGSKVATSGSALTFNGTNLTIGSGGKLLYSGVSYGVGIDPDGSGGFGAGYNFETNGGTPRYLVTGPISGQYISSGSSPFVAWYLGSSAASGTAAPEQMRLNATGLGVGTSSPSAKLQSNVSRTSGTNEVAFVLSDNVTGSQTSGFGTQIQGWSNNGSAKSAIGFEAYGGTNNDTGLGFYTQNTAGGLTRQMTISSVGYVGIRTSSPEGFLHVAPGNAAAASTAGAPIILQAQTGGSSAAGGNILIGSGQNGSGGANGYIAFGIGSSTSGSAFATGEAMRISASGKVGIGNTAPDLTLDVYGTNGTNGDAYRIVTIQTNDSANANIGGGISFGGYFNGTTNRTNDFAGIQGFKENSTAGDYAGALRFTTRINGGSPTERMRISSAGNVAIGSSTVYNGGGFGRVLSIYDSTAAALSYANASRQYQAGINSASQFGIYDATASAYRFVVATDGSVGIGESSPSIRLQVSGPMNVAAANFKSVISANSTDSQAADTGAGITLGGVYSGSSQTAFAQIAGVKENSTSGNFAGALTFYSRPNGGTLYERARITSAGQLVVGATSATNNQSLLQATTGPFPLWSVGSSTGYCQGAIVSASGTDSSPEGRGQGMYLWNQGNNTTWYVGTMYGAADTWAVCRHAAAGFQDDTAQATYAKLIVDSSGNLLVGTTSAGGYGVTIRGSVTPTQANISKTGTTATSTKHWSFQNDNGEVGYISTLTTATTYSTSSDYRLKNTIAPMTGALAKVAQLKPVTYKWNADGSDGEGFIAHELAEVVPQCVTGEKDAVDADGNPVYQGIDTSFLVATLTAAIQEQQAIIESLKARLDAANL